jgi:hypothetical protein
MKKVKATMMIVALITVSLVSCAPSKWEQQTKKSMDSWLGSSKQALILEWGAPDRITTDGSTGEVLVYTKTASAHNAYYSVTQYATYMFYVHAAGDIYFWKAERGTR